MVKGQSPNPRGNPDMRRLQGVLNARYSDEQYAVTVLDWARAHTLKDGTPYPDRAIMNEALVALGKQHGVKNANDAPRLNAPDERGVNINLLASELGARLEAILNRVLSSVQINNGDDWEQQREAIAKEVNTAISTANLTGKSYEYDPSEEDE